MKRLGVTFLMAVFMGACLMLVEVAPAEAHTCSSVCNQIRRACIKVAKVTRQVARAVCEDGRDACRADCAANEATCPADCATNCGGDAVCEAECLDDCANCVPNCNAAREGCLEAAGLQRQADKLACADARESCPDTCVEPIDNNCVRGCKAAERGCKKVAKGIERQCKKDCVRGPGRRACVRECRKQNNVALQGCSNQEILCLGACAGIIQ
ncbi:MAG: hypothetical protein ACYSVY_24970 [Planctomycetota bacterium]|jgi:hypothetical protein